MVAFCAAVNLAPRDAGSGAPAPSHSIAPPVNMSNSQSRFALHGAVFRSSIIRLFPRS